MGDRRVRPRYRREWPGRVRWMNHTRSGCGWFYPWTTWMTSTGGAGVDRACVDGAAGALLPPRHGEPPQPPRRPIEAISGVVAQHLLLQCTELVARLDTEIAVQHVPDVVEDLQGFGPPVSRGQRLHEAPSEVLAKRERRGE